MSFSNPFDSWKNVGCLVCTVTPVQLSLRFCRTSDRMVISDVGMLVGDPTVVNTTCFRESIFALVSMSRLPDDEGSPWFLGCPERLDRSSPASTFVKSLAFRLNFGKVVEERTDRFLRPRVAILPKIQIKLACKSGGLIVKILRMVCFGSGSHRSVTPRRLSARVLDAVHFSL